MMGELLEVLAIGLGTGLTITAPWTAWLLYNTHTRKLLRTERRRRATQSRCTTRWDKASADLPGRDLIWLDAQRKLSGPYG